MLISCGPDYKTTHYIAISSDKRDTALLKLLTSEGSFYGNYQIKYDDTSMDDGTISGHIKGDTLIGKFSYLSRENVKSMQPIAFLKEGKALQLGTGTIGTYLGLSVYKYGSIKFNDSLYLFQPIEKEPNSQRNSAE